MTTYSAQQNLELPGKYRYLEIQWSFDSPEGKLHLLHDLLNSEFITVERMGRSLPIVLNCPVEHDL
ncbi:MAG: hypothetical protein V1799_16885 [bacterium]